MTSVSILTAENNDEMFHGILVRQDINTLLEKI